MHIREAVIRHRILNAVLVLAACSPQPPTPATPSAHDPRVEVTDWSQVERFNCGEACTNDSDCGEGHVCDASDGCRCCVLTPPPIPPVDQLRRYVFSPLRADGSCETPQHFERVDLETAESRIVALLSMWFTSYRPNPGDSATSIRQQLCILEEPSNPCVWEVRVSSGDAVAQAPMPMTHQEYECGGRTCNGQSAVLFNVGRGALLSASLIIL